MLAISELAYRYPRRRPTGNAEEKIICVGGGGLSPPKGAGLNVAHHSFLSGQILPCSILLLISQLNPRTSKEKNHCGRLNSLQTPASAGTSIFVLSDNSQDVQLAARRMLHAAGVWISGGY
jgi:hypothetical protein